MNYVERFGSSDPKSKTKDLDLGSQQNYGSGWTQIGTNTATWSILNSSIQTRTKIQIFPICLTDKKQSENVRQKC
jgi:hypothetical protein